MTRELALGIMIALGVLALAGMTWSILSRRRKGDLLPAFPGAHILSGPEIAAFSVLHVATTMHNHPLERVWTAPLAYRAKTTLRLLRDGVLMELTGEGDVGIPADRIVGVSRATWTIDKAVDPEGLIVISWESGDTVFDTYLRSVDQPADTVLELMSTLIDHTQEDVA